MSDIFISYARTDREKIEKLASTLEAAGFSVWWDRQIVGGVEFSAEIESQLDASKAVIVVWSQAGIASPWVRDEASRAQRQRKLIPVKIDGVESPMGFGQYQAVDLSHWRSGADAPEFENLLRSLALRLTGETPDRESGNHRSLVDNILKPLPVAAICVVIMAAAGGGVMWQRAHAPSENAISSHNDGLNSSASNVLPANSIAVLPFTDLSPKGDQEFFTDGLTEEILSVLAKSGALKVAGRTSSFQFKESGENLQVIGDALGVSYVLEGSVRKSGDHIRITAQLVKTDDGFNIWSETYDRRLSELFVVQEEIAVAIGEAVGAPLGVQSEALSEARTDNPEAYQLYLEAVAHWARRGDDLLLAVRKLEHATALEPDFAAAWAVLSLVYELVPLYLAEIDGRPVVPEAYWIKTIRTARQSVELNPGLANAQHALANALRYENQWAAAEDAYRRALEIDPNAHAVMEDYSEFLNYVGHHDKALQLAQRAVELDPASSVYRFKTGRSLRAMGQPDDALIVLTHIVSYWAFAAELAMATLIDAGDLDKAVALLDEHDIRNDEVEAIYRRLIMQAKNPQANFKPDPAWSDTWLRIEPYFAALGADHALDVLAHMNLNNIEPYVGLMQDTTTMAALRGNPRFAQLAEDLDLPAYWRLRGWPKFCRSVSQREFECSAEENN